MVDKRRWDWLWALALALGACSKEDPGSLLLPGTLERHRIALTAPVTEILAERPVQEGQHVTAGALIARMDDTRLRAELGIYAAAVERARAQLAELEAGTPKERVAQAEAEYSGAVAAAESSEIELGRVKKLHSEKLVPQSQLDLAQATRDQAQAQRRRASQVLEELRRGATGESRDAAKAALAEAQARLDEAQARLAQLTLLAPSDAIVEELVFEVGERPPAGAIVVILVADSAPYARVFVPERAISRIREEQPARLAIDGVEGTLEGRFRFVATEAMFTPYYALTDRERDRLVFRATVDVTDPRARSLRSGIPVQVLVPLEPSGGQTP